MKKEEEVTDMGLWNTTIAIPCDECKKIRKFRLAPYNESYSEHGNSYSKYRLFCPKCGRTRPFKLMFALDSHNKVEPNEDGIYYSLFWKPANNVRPWKKNINKRKVYCIDRFDNGTHRLYDNYIIFKNNAMYGLAYNRPSLDYNLFDFKDTAEYPFEFKVGNEYSTDMFDKKINHPGFKAYKTYHDACVAGLVYKSMTKNSEDVIGEIVVLKVECKELMLKNVFRVGAEKIPILYFKKMRILGGR